MCVWHVKTEREGFLYFFVSVESSEWTTTTSTNNTNIKRNKGELTWNEKKKMEKKIN